MDIKSYHEQRLKELQEKLAKVNDQTALITFWDDLGEFCIATAHKIDMSEYTEDKGWAVK